MDGDFSAAVDYLALARTKTRLDGQIEVAHLPRFGATLADDQGSVSARLAFTLDAAGDIIVTGRLSADVQMTCQRCLGAMVYPIKSEFRVALVQSEAAIAALPAHLEPYVVSEQTLEPLRLIEDELLLCLPIVARHADTESCVPPALPEGVSATADESTANPFAVLKDLTSNSISEKH